MGGFTSIPRLGPAEFISKALKLDGSCEIVFCFYLFKFDTTLCIYIYTVCVCVTAHEE